MITKTWRNADNTIEVKFVLISYWEYISSERETSIYKGIVKTASPTLIIPSTLKIVIDGVHETLTGEDADSLYKILSR